MQRNTERCCGSGKLFWKEVVGKGDLISSETVMITVVLPQQLGLQIRAEDVSIRVQRNGTPAYGNGVIIHGRYA